MSPLPGGQGKARLQRPLSGQRKAVGFFYRVAIGRDLVRQIVHVQHPADPALKAMVKFKMVGRKGPIRTIPQDAPIQKVPLGVEIGFVVADGRSVQQ